MLKAVVVEDEKISRETLLAFLKKYCSEVTVLAEAENAHRAIEIIDKYQPDLVFLDVEMPFGNAFDVLEKVSFNQFETIFITAFDQYAMQALNFSASYYILKPINIDELVKAVTQISQRKKTEEHSLRTKILIDNIRIENKQLQKIILPLMDGFEVVKVKDIMRCKAEDNFTCFYLADSSKKMVCRTLKHYEEILSEFDFIRVHKSHLININYVKRYRKGKGGQVILSDNTEIDVSQNRKVNFLSMFK